MELVCGDAHHAEEVPDLGTRYIGKRVVFHQRSWSAGKSIEYRVDLDDGYSLTGSWGLILTLSSDPSVELSELASQRTNFTYSAAFTMAVFIEREHSLGTDEFHGFLGIREGVFNVDLVMLFNSVEELVGFGI